MHRNERFIFFRLIDGEGPIGAQGVPLTAGRSLAVDPAFAGGGSYRPIDESPVNDHGTNNPSGGVIATDLEGRPRIIGKRMDLGAYESDAILRDGFESGGLLGGTGARCRRPRHAQRRPSATSRHHRRPPHSRRST